MNDTVTPAYRLLKNYPGNSQPVGTVFYHTTWGGPEGMFRTEHGMSCTSWNKQYFEPFVGEFFEKLNEF